MFGYEINARFELPKNKEYSDFKKWFRNKVAKIEEKKGLRLKVTCKKAHDGEKSGAVVTFYADSMSDEQYKVWEQACMKLINKAVMVFEANCTQYTKSTTATVSGKSFQFSIRHEDSKEGLPYQEEEYPEEGLEAVFQELQELGTGFIQEIQKGALKVKAGFWGLMSKVLGNPENAAPAEKASASEDEQKPQE